MSEDLSFESLETPLTPVKFSSKLKKFMKNTSQKTALFLVRTLVFIVIRAWVVGIFTMIRQIPGIEHALGPSYNLKKFKDTDKLSVRSVSSLGESFILNAIDGFFKFFNRFFKLNKTIYGVVSPMIASLVVLLISYLPLQPAEFLYNVGKPEDSSTVVLAKKSVHAALMGISLIVTQYIMRESLKSLQQTGSLGFGRVKSASARRRRSANPGRRSAAHKHKKH